MRTVKTMKTKKDGQKEDGQREDSENKFLYISKDEATQAGYRGRECLKVRWKPPVAGL
jgi:hypothetical protein